MAGGKKAALQKARKAIPQSQAPTKGVLEAFQGDNTVVIPQSPRVNWYLATLLDPTLWEEAVAHGVRGVPDFYSHRNHIFVTRTVHDLDSSNFDGSGKCTILNRPSLINHLSYTDNHGVANVYSVGDYTAIAGYLKGVDDRNTGIGSLQAISGHLVNAGTYTFPTTGVLKCRDNNSNCVAIMAENPTANQFSFRYPIAAGSASINFKMGLIMPATAAGNFTLSYMGPTGASSVNIAVAIGDTSVSGVLPFNAADTYFSAFSVINSTGGDLFPASVQIVASITAPTSYASLLSESAQNFDFAVNNLTAYRPVAGYCWVKYRGKLTSNGSIAGALIDSATNPVLSRVSEYDTIAGLLHSYEGTITEGNYSIWCPMNPRDTNYTDVHDDRSEAPYIAVGIDADDVDSQQVRLECFWVWEGLTQNQMLAPKPGSVDIEMMNDAFAKLAHFDKSMENDLHLKKIAEFLRRSGKRGAKAMLGYLKDPSHRGSLISAAEQLARLSGSFSPTISAAAQMALRAARAANSMS